VTPRQRHRLRTVLIVALALLAAYKL